jgi:hypothetical protein
MIRPEELADAACDDQAWRLAVLRCFHSQRHTGFSRSSGAGSCGMSGNRTQLGWLAVNPQIVPSSHSAKNPLEAVLIWMILLTARHSLPVFPKRFRNVRGHHAHLLNCLLKLLRGHTKLLCPIWEFVIFADIDPVAVPGNRASLCRRP